MGKLGSAETKLAENRVRTRCFCFVFLNRFVLLCFSGVKDVEYYRPYGKDEPRQKLLELESIVCSVENLNTFPVVAELCSIGKEKRKKRKRKQKTKKTKTLGTQLLLSTQR
jgi:hypothetical protein